MAFTEKEILKALSYVDDPDLRKDLVTLNMIKDLKVEGKKVSFKVELTTPACPMKEHIQKACETAIRHMVDKEAEIHIEMSASVTTPRDSGEQLLPGVKNIIAVVSGKGGVGKSTIAVNLALGLANTGAKVGIIDADIYGPSIPLMMGLKGAKPKVVERNGKPTILPLEKFGIKVLSIGFLVDEKQAVVWRGPMVSSALRQFVGDCEWGELDYMVIDMPPGTGDVHLTLVQTVPVTGSIIVTTPQEVALADARKAIGMFNISNINVPILGIIENMSFFTPPELPDNKYYIFGKEGGKGLSEEYGIPLLGQVPIVEQIREGGDSGLPAAMNVKDAVSYEAFREIANSVAQQVSIRNANMAPTQKVEMQN